MGGEGRRGWVGRWVGPTLCSPFFFFFRAAVIACHPFKTTTSPVAAASTPAGGSGASAPLWEAFRPVHGHPTHRHPRQHRPLPLWLRQRGASRAPLPQPRGKSWRGVTPVRASGCHRNAAGGATSGGPPRLAAPRRTAPHCAAPHRPPASPSQTASGRQAPSGGRSEAAAAAGTISLSR